MPNHYDIDIHCKKCGKYIRTYSGDDDAVRNDDRLCYECKSKRRDVNIRRGRLIR